MLGYSVSVSLFLALGLAQFSAWRVRPELGTSRESVLLCAPVWDLLWHKAVSKSEKADLQVFITCAGCLPLRIGSRMSEHRGREVSKLKDPEHHLDLFTLMAVKR